MEYLDKKKNERRLLRTMLDKIDFEIEELEKQERSASRFKDITGICIHIK